MIESQNRMLNTTKKKTLLKKNDRAPSSASQNYSGCSHSKKENLMSLINKIYT